MDSLPFGQDQKFDWLIFNPQIGGDYNEGELEIEQTIKVVISDKAFEDYLKEVLGVEFTLDIDEKIKRITVHSNSVTKANMKENLDSIRVWNYYDIFYQAGQTKLEGTESNIVKLRKNLDSIVSDKHSVIFLGEEKHFNVLFYDYTNVHRYMANDGKDLFVASKSGESKTRCYERNEAGEFVDNLDCKKSNSILQDLGSLDEVFIGLNQAVNDLKQQTVDNPFGQKDEGSSEQLVEASILENQEVPVTSQPECSHVYDFAYKNLLLKGVPGTGKSRLLERIIEQKLNIDKKMWDHHVLRVNIHSASSNADLMQGIAVTADGGNIAYSEKRGLIFDLICRTCQFPNQPFVLVLEEIQENSLNELIGDLIYLIEDDKRADLSKIPQSLEGKDSLGLIEAYVQAIPDVQYVKIPNLVSLGEYRKMILPANIYIFCTSNYRDDKKIIEDNLLRRFEVIDLYPHPKAIKDLTVRSFFESLNQVILEVLKAELHPDRFEIGHASWMGVTDKASFARALYKTVIELKEIREIQPSNLEAILDRLHTKFKSSDILYVQEVVSSIDPKNLVETIKKLQKLAYDDLMQLVEEISHAKEE